MKSNLKKASIAFILQKQCCLLPTGLCKRTTVTFLLMLCFIFNANSEANSCSTYQRYMASSKLASAKVFSKPKAENKAHSSSPWAEFEPDCSVCYGSTPIQFINLSSNAISYHWDFGDGTNSTEKNPSHIYTAPGSYLVVLTVIGAGQEQAMFIGTVDILDT